MANGGRPMRAARRYKEQTLLMRTLTAEAEGLVAEAKSEEVKAECLKVYEALRYSDPMSTLELAEIEEQMVALMGELKTAVRKKKGEEIKDVILQLSEAIRARSRASIKNK